MHMYGGDKIMSTQMIELEMKPFIKYIVLKVDLFESEIIDEINFGINEEYKILKFKEKYIRRDDCILVKIEM